MPPTPSNRRPAAPKDSPQEPFRRAVAGSRVRVEIVRDGQSINLTVPLR